MPVGEDNAWIRMDFAIRQPRHPMVHAAGQFANLRMQRAAEGDIHLLETAADAEQRHAAGNAGLRYRQRDLVAMEIVGFVLDIGFGVEARGMDIGPRPRQHDAIDRIQERADIGNLGRTRKHQWQSTCDFGQRTEIAFTDHLRRETIFEAMGVADHADHGPFHYLCLAQERSSILGTVPS